MDIMRFNVSDQAVKKSLKRSFGEGVLGSLMAGFTADFFAPFLLAVGATARHIGILNSMQNLMSSLGQLLSANLTYRLKSRRKIILLAVFGQALLILGMVVVSLLCASGLGVFMGIAIIFSGLGAVGVAPMSSLLSDYIPADKRGSYFGWRGKVMGLVGVSAAFSAGLILGPFQHSPYRCYGFALIFAMAFLFRLGSWQLIRQMHEPQLAHSRQDQFTLIMFVRRLRESNFAKFTLFVALMNMSVNIASPFFAVLMIRDLHFSYPLYAAVTVTATLTVCLLSARWGMIGDRVGNLRVVQLTAPLIGFIPLLWILDRHPVSLFIFQVFSGFAWSGFNIAIANYILDAVSAEKRTRCIAYFNFFNGLGLCLGALIGGMLLRYLPELLGYRILTLLVISSLLRLVVGFLLPRALKEVRLPSGADKENVWGLMFGTRRLSV